MVSSSCLRPLHMLPPHLGPFISRACRTAGRSAGALARSHTPLARSHTHMTRSSTHVQVAAQPEEAVELYLAADRPRQV